MNKTGFAVALIAVLILNIIGSPAIKVKAASALETRTFDIGGVQFKMILVEAGTFTMGSDNDKTAFNESPAHTVTLTQNYLIGETEVTEALWNAVMGKSGGSKSLPKTSVTWKDASSFCEKLTETARKAGVIDSTVRFSLPTEAQWEFAAKGGNLSQGYLYSGSNDINDVAVTRENSGSDSPISVKTKNPNELGIYDMSGNAYEWVDAYAGDYTTEPETDPVSHPSGTYVKRGGSNYHYFKSEPYLFTTTGRYFYGSTDWTIGFRLCMVAESGTDNDFGDVPKTGIREMRWRTYLMAVCCLVAAPLWIVVAKRRSSKRNGGRR